MPRALALAALVLLAAGCAGGLAGEPTPTTATDFRPAQIRQPMIVVRVTFGPGTYDPRERDILAGEYQGALLEGLNARAVLARDVEVRGERDRKPEARAAVARARELGADHVIAVEVQVARAETVFCRPERRPFYATVNVWRQGVEVARAADGALRVVVAQGSALDQTEFDADCENPRRSRRLAPREAIEAAVKKLLGRVLGP